MKGDPIEHLKTAAQTIFDKKGINILGLDVRGVSALTDYVLIAEGAVDRHVAAMAHEIIEELKAQGERPYQVEGLESGDWVVIDYLDYMIHIFMPGLRDKYGLEALFKEGKIIDLDIKTEPQGK